MFLTNMLADLVELFMVCNNYAHVCSNVGSRTINGYELYYYYYYHYHYCFLCKRQHWITMCAVALYFNVMSVVLCA